MIRSPVAGRRSPVKLHIGCGPQILEGWINIDNVRYRGINKKLDVRRGLPFKDVQFIFAEHFIEHLSYFDAAKLFRECRRVLREDGVLRLSTPNLDWVWMSHYRLDAADEEQLANCFHLNRAFRAWGHQFLYNEKTLRATLFDAGFGSVVRCDYGKSDDPELSGLERHELSPPFGSLSSILIVEASGRGGNPPADLAQLQAEYFRDVMSR